MGSIEELRSRAEQGEATARFELGYAYHYGESPLGGTIRIEGFTIDHELAFKWYHLAAKQGLPEAQFYLGLMYADGEGVAANDKEAFKWFHQAATRGDAVAQGNVGVAYQIGRGVGVDEAEAVRWLRMAAEQEYRTAQTNLGAAYAEGAGVTKDLTEAVQWFRKAAEHGCAVARNNLGLAYQLGQGVAQDDSEAVKWFSLAAEQGNSEAQSNLDEMNSNGNSVKVGSETAVSWEKINWKATLFTHLCRAIATGVVGLLLSMLIGSNSFMDGLAFLVAAPIAFFLLVLPVSLLCLRFNAKVGPIIKYMGFTASLGDPLLWAFNKVTKEQFLPVRDLSVFSLSLVLYVVKDE